MKKINFPTLRSSSGRRESGGDEEDPEPCPDHKRKSKSGLLKTIKRKLTLQKKKEVVSEGACGGCERKHTGPGSWRAAPRHVTKPVRSARSEEGLDQLPRVPSPRHPSPHTSGGCSSGGCSSGGPRPPPRHSKHDSRSSEDSREDSSGSDRSKEVFAIDTEYGHASAPHPGGTPPSHPTHPGGTGGSTGEESPGIAVAAANSPQQQLYENYEASMSLISSRQAEFFLPNVYDQVKEVPKIWSLTKELFKLSRFGWYWGPITRQEAEEKLSQQPDGAFLVRDSSDERYLLSLSFRSYGRTLHTRIEHCNGVFSFYAQPESEGYSSIVDLIKHSMSDSQTGVFCYSRARTPGSPSFPVRLTKPVSRFTQVRSLQYLCRFVIRQYTRFDHIQKLPLPSSIKGWLEENQY